MASLSRFLYQNLFLPLATGFAFVSLYLSPLFNFIKTFVVLRLRRCKAVLNKNSGFKDDYQKASDFPGTEQQLDYESDDVFKDVSEFADSENNGETEETEFNFTFKFPTYEEFCKSKEDKGEFVRMPSAFNIKSLTEANVIETEDSKEADSKIEAINEEGDHGFKSWKQSLAETQGKASYSRPLWSGPSLDSAHSGRFNASSCPLNEEGKGDLINLECDKEAMEKTEETNSIKGEPDTGNKQILEEPEEFLFQSENDSSISTDSDTVSIGFDHICYLMNKLVDDSYSDEFLTDDDFGGEFELDDALNNLEMSEENQESDDNDTDSDIMEEVRKLELEQDQAPQFLCVDDFYKQFGDSENVKSRNEDANKLETLWEHQELIEQLKMELKKVRDTGLPTIFEESDTLKMDDLEPWKIDEKLQREDCMSELHKFYKSYRERMRKFDILTYQKMYAIGYLQKDPLKDPFQQVSRQRCSGPKLKSLISFKHKRHYDNIDPIVKFIKELQSDLEVIYVGQMCLSWEFLHWQYGKALSLWDSDPRGTRTYNEVAGEFQQFQVLLQRFIENEPFQGPRVQYYIKSRYDLRNLLQVPVIREDRMKDENKDRGREKDEYYHITSDMLVEIVEESIRIFWQFVRADRHCSSLTVKGQKGTQHQELKALGDLELLMEVKKGLQKKEKKLKEALRGGCCILKRFKKQKEDDSDHVLYFFSQVDMKLVTRVLNMSRLTTDQLVWCHNKLSRISFLHREIHVDPAFLLFPC